MSEYEVMLLAPRGHLNPGRESFLGEYIGIAAQRQHKDNNCPKEELKEELARKINWFMQHHDFRYKSFYDIGFFKFTAESLSDAKQKAQEFMLNLTETLGMDVAWRNPSLIAQR